jgi:hypothetical protein
LERERVFGKTERAKKNFGGRQTKMAWQVKTEEKRTVLFGWVKSCFPDENDVFAIIKAV